MYKILVINDSIQNVQKSKNIKYLNSKETIQELKNVDYDFIIINDKEKTNLLEKAILADYMQLPKELKKIVIKSEANNTYINLQIVNKLIFDNLEFIDFKNYYEKTLIALIIKQFLIGETDIKTIYKNICPKELKEKDLGKTVEKVIIRDYSTNSLIRKYKFYIYRRRIITKFFENILVNIKNDIKNMEKLGK